MAAAMRRAAKILCGRCGRKVGTVTEDEGKRSYEITVAGGGWSATPLGIFCQEHGWPDLNDPKFGEKLKFTRDGQPATYKAKMLPRPPQYP
jgi:hypothetical protein